MAASALRPLGFIFGVICSVALGCGGGSSGVTLETWLARMGSGDSAWASVGL